MVKLKITSFDQISKLLDKLHDRNFDLDSSVYNSEEKTLSISFFIEMPEYKEKVRKGILFIEYKMLLVEHILIINNVKDYLIDDTEKIRFYPFNTFNYLKEEKKT